MSDQIERRKIFLKAYVDHFSPMSGKGAGDRFMLDLERIAGASQKKLAHAVGLAVSDVVNDCEDLPQVAVAKIDAYMASIGAASLSELRIECSRRLKKILGRSEIRDDFEAYFVKDIMDSGVSHPESDFSLQLQGLLLRYVEKRTS